MRPILTLTNRLDGQPAKPPLPVYHPCGDGWIVLVQQGTIQQAFAPQHAEDAFRALAESPLRVEAYRVADSVNPPPRPGAQATPSTRGWYALVPSID